MYALTIVVILSILCILSYSSGWKDGIEEYKKSLDNKK